MTICYHTTDAADAILSGGFRDSIGSIVPGEGVFLSEHPLMDAMEGATGDQLLRVKFGDDVNLNIYELPVGAPRQWFMPAAVINEHATVTLLSDDERDAAVNTRLSGLAAVTTTCYAIAALDSDGKPLKYLPFYGEGWTPGTNYKLQSDPAIAWRFGDKQVAEETAAVMNATHGNSPELHVIEVDCDGPPLTLVP